MSESMMKNINDNVNNIYKTTETSVKEVGSKVHSLYGDVGKKYFDKYGGSVIITVLATLLIIGIILYINTKNNLTYIKENWNELKCNPKYAPFAGLIIPEEGKSFVQVGTENANYCFNRILREVSDDTMMPYHAIINVFNQLTQKIVNVGNDIRNLSNTMRDKLKTSFEDQYNRIINSVIPMQKMFITVKAMMAKMKGAMVTSVYPMLGLYYTLKASIDGVYNIIVKILIKLAETIIVLWIFPFTWGAAASMTGIFMLIMIPMAILSTMMGEIFHLSPRGLPGKPKHRHCFNGDYEIMTSRGKIPLSKLLPGDKIGEDTVTSVMKLSAEGETMYYIDNGLLVSGNHKIYNGELGDFIDVNDDYRFERYLNFKDEFIYCFNTTSKTIRLENHLFLDYDELSNSELTKIIYEYKKLLPKWDFKRASIHWVFDGGFNPLTEVAINDNTIKPIEEIKVGDILEEGNKVEGIVKIDNTIGVFNIKTDKHNTLKDINANIIYYDKNNKKQSALYIKKKDRSKDNVEPYNVHLLTTKGYFHVNKIKVGDYDSCLEYFTDKKTT